MCPHLGGHEARLLVAPPGSQEAHGLADKPVQAGQAERGEEADRRHAGIPGHLEPQAAEAGEIPVMGPVIDHADQQEHHGARHAVVEHLKRRAVDPVVGHRGEAEQHVAHVADGGIGDQALEVFLRQRAEGPIHDIDHSKNRQQGDEEIARGGIGKHRVADPEETVASHLQQDPRQHDTDRGRSLNVGIRKPGVEREYGDLDGKADKESEEEPPLQAV